MVPERTLCLNFKPCAHIRCLEFFKGQKYKNYEFLREIQPAQPHSVGWLLPFTAKTYTQILGQSSSLLFQRFLTFIIVLLILAAILLFSKNI